MLLSQEEGTRPSEWIWGSFRWLFRCDIAIACKLEPLTNGQNLELYYWERQAALKSPLGASAGAIGRRFLLN
jgi:hypothetical protein